MINEEQQWYRVYTQISPHLCARWDAMSGIKTQIIDVCAWEINKQI